MRRDGRKEQQAFTYSQTGNGRQIIPQRRSLAPGQGNYYQTESPPANPHRSGHSSGIHPEDQPFMTGDPRQYQQTKHRSVQRLDRPTRTGTPTRSDVYVDPRPEHEYRRTPDGGVEIVDDVLNEEEYDDPPRLPSSTRRYDIDLDGLPMQRRTRVATHYHDEPLVTERQPAQRRRHKEPRHRRRIHFHRLVYAGIGLLLMLAGYIAFNILGAWWQVHQDDATYGNPRTYQTDAVVGHFDSATNPTHFIAMNLKGQVIIIELPGGDTGKARSYNVTTIPDNSSNPPVKIVFQDLNHDGKLDMVIEIGDPGSVVTIFFYNNGSQFVPKL